MAGAGPVRFPRPAWRDGPLADRNFCLLSVGQLASTIGDLCYAVALPWLILSVHGGVALLGIVLACYGAARTVLVPVGGMLADKIGPRVTMLAADLGRCVLVAGLALLAARRLDSLVVLGPVAALIGAGEGLFLPASFSIIPAFLAPEKLQAGNALSTALVQAGTMAGPIVGGILVATAGSSPAFAVDAGTFAISALALALIRIRPAGARAEGAKAAGLEPAETRAGGLEVQGLEPAGSAAGADAGASDAVPAGVVAAADPAPPPSLWAMLRRSRELQLMLLIGVMSNLAFGGSFEVALPALAHAHFGANGYGVLITCAGAGAVLGSLAAGRGGSLGRPMYAACAVVLIEALAIGLVPFAVNLVGTAGAIGVFGIGNGFSDIVLLTVVQKWAPGEMLGRIMSLFIFASIGIFPLSVAAAGLLVRHLGTTPFFLAAGSALAGAVLLTLSQRSMRDIGLARRPAEAGLSSEDVTAGV
jgi:MFS family permease